MNKLTFILSQINIFPTYSTILVEHMGDLIMKLTYRSEYALLALIDLAENKKEGVSKTANIAKRKKIPKKYLEQILLVLKRSGYVKSKQGAQGGYKLAKLPEEISLAEIIRLMDGALAPVESVSKYFYESSPIEQNEKLINIFYDIRDYVSNKMENTKLSDLV